MITTAATVDMHEQGNRRQKKVVAKKEARARVEMRGIRATGLGWAEFGMGWVTPPWAGHAGLASTARGWVAVHRLSR